MKISSSRVLYLLALLSATLMLFQYETVAHYSYLEALETFRYQSMDTNACTKASHLWPFSIIDGFHPSIVRDFQPWLFPKIHRPTSPRCQLIILRNGSQISYLMPQGLPLSLYNKARALDTQIRWVTKRLYPGGKVISMCFHLGSTPVHSAGHVTDHPIYSLAKNEDHLDILYPNMYFGFGGSLDDWDHFQKKVSEEAARHPYRDRQDRAFWRGTCGDYKHNKARVHLVLAGRNSTLLDVGFSKNCPISKGGEGNMEDEAERSLVQEVNAVPNTKFINPLQMTTYKYQFSMPGSAKGSYSRHMQTALCSNATVFLWDNDYYEFYYSLLKPWLHFVPVSATTLDARLQWAVAHQEEAELIAARGFEFCMTQLTPAAFPVYWFQIFTMHGLLQDYEVKAEEISEGCTCDSNYRGQAACVFC